MRREARPEPPSSRSKARSEAVPSRGKLVRPVERNPSPPPSPPPVLAAAQDFAARLRDPDRVFQRGAAEALIQENALVIHRLAGPEDVILLDRPGKVAELRRPETVTF